MEMVKVVEEFQISPPPPGSLPPPTSLPLTFFDLKLLNVPPMRYFFFYQFPHSKAHFLTTTLPTIKHSLSLALQHFYPFAGNVLWSSNKHQIVYKEGDTVSFTVAESDSDFHDVSGNHFRDANWFYHYLVPKPSCIQAVNPSLAVQVTLFENKGICLTVSHSHTVADGRAFSTFVKSWACMCMSQAANSSNNACEIDLPPLGDRSTFTFRDAEAREMDIMDGVQKHLYLNTDELVIDKFKATFVMSTSNIKKLKQWISSFKLGKSLQRYLSSFVVTCAYTWVCLVKARWGGCETGSEDAMEYLLFAADVRGRLDPPLPETYFGNCVHSNIAITKRCDLVGEDGIAVAAETIATEIQNMDIYKKEERDCSFFVTSPMQIVVVTGSPRFGLYQTDFGWGAPKKVEIGEDCISLLESPTEQGAIEIGVTRHSIEIQAFASLFANSITVLS